MTTVYGADRPTALLKMNDVVGALVFEPLSAAAVAAGKK